MLTAASIESNSLLTPYVEEPDEVWQLCWFVVDFVPLAGKRCGRGEFCERNETLFGMWKLADRGFEVDSVFWGAWF